MKKIELLSAAESDLTETITYYNQQQTNLGYEFSDEVKRTLARILDFPTAWPRLSRSTRQVQVNRFPYGVIYQNRRDKILIVAVMNLHSEPNCWKDRIGE